MAAGTLLLWLKVTPRPAAPSSVSERAGGCSQTRPGERELGGPRGELGQHRGAAGPRTLCEERLGLPGVGHGRLQRPL